MKNKQVKHRLKRIQPKAFKEVGKGTDGAQEDSNDETIFYRKLHKLTKDQERWWRTAGGKQKSPSGNKYQNPQDQGANKRQGTESSKLMLEDQGAEAFSHQQRLDILSCAGGNVGTYDNFAQVIICGNY